MAAQPISPRRHEAFEKLAQHRLNRYATVTDALYREIEGEGESLSLTQLETYVRDVLGKPVIGNDSALVTEYGKAFRAEFPPDAL